LQRIGGRDLSAPLICVVGTRPNFVKIAPILRAFAESEAPLPAKLVHTGQHYDHNMSEIFFAQLGVPQPDIDLGVGPTSPARQIGEIMTRFSAVLEREPARAVIVVGDVNSTLACALAASTSGVPVVHVEAGLRSFDRRMPEEINRVLTDQISDLLFTTEVSAEQNLAREGIDPMRIRFVGNVMIDSLEYCLPKAPPAKETLSSFGDFGAICDGAGGYGVVTIHRPSNVDDPARLKELLSSLETVSETIPLIFPLHPRTQERLAAVGQDEQMKGGQVVFVPPLGYLEMLGLLSAAKLVITDSGGIQEETTFLGVPCLTVRENTERPVTVSEGTNTIVGLTADGLIDAATRAARSGVKKDVKPAKWDGRSAQRIARELDKWLGETGR